MIAKRKERSGYFQSVTQWNREGASRMFFKVRIYPFFVNLKSTMPVEWSIKIRLLSLMIWIRGTLMHVHTNAASHDTHQTWMMKLISHKMTGNTYWGTNKVLHERKQIIHIKTNCSFKLNIALVCHQFKIITYLHWYKKSIFLSLLKCTLISQEFIVFNREHKELNGERRLQIGS